MAQFSLRFRVRAKDNWSPAKTNVVLNATKLAENANMTENQSHFAEGDSPTNQIILNMDRATEKSVFQIGSDCLVTFATTS